MTDQGSITDCGTDVLVNFAESLHIFTGLLSVATGVFSGTIAAALLYVFCLKPMILTRQGYNARRLLEPDDGEAENNQSDCVSNSKKEVHSGTSHLKEKKQQQKQPAMNSDVAAFACRAKVVYPINQKYRPLADGASNPSLHEHSKLPAMSNEESSASSSGASLSQEQDDNDSSQFISSSLVPKSLQNQSFTRVSHYPHTLAQPGFEGRISLYCLALQDIQQQCSQLQEEKCLIFLHTMKILFSGHFPKDKDDADFSANVILMQEKGLEQLKRELSVGPSAGERDKDPDAPCTLEELERAQKDLLEHGLQMTKGFSKQVENLCQHLLDRTSVLPTEQAHDVIQALIHALLLVENHLADSQEVVLKRTQQRLLWWEELMGLLQSQPALLRQEVSLRQGLVARTLEQLTSDDLLTFALMEKTLAELQTSLTEGLQQCTEECRRKTKELVSDRCRKTDSKRRKLQRTQAKERSGVLDSAQTHSDPQQFIKLYQEVLVKHRQQSADLELQQDDRVAHALCDLWRKLHTSWSKRLWDRAKQVFLSALPAQSELSPERGERLWQDAEQALVTQRQQAEATTKLQLEAIRAQLDQDGQLWCEETALVLGCLRHLGEQQMKIVRAMVVRQSYTLNSQVGFLVEKKQQHLLAAVQRHFAARHVCLGLLKEMRLSKLKVLSQTDFRALEEQGEGPPAAGSTAKPPNKDSSASLAEQHLGPESQLVGQSFQQEFLSELETGAELLQSHAQLLLGNALSHAVWQQMEAPESKARPLQDNGWKRQLTEAASESVYMTKDSLSSLVQSYYSQLQDITKKLQHERSSNKEETERRESSSQLSKALLRELANWARKPTSTEFQQRVELQKRRVLEQCDLEQEVLCETLRRRKVSLEQAMDTVKGELLEAEEAFIVEVAGLARVPLHSPEPEPSGPEDNASEGTPAVNILNLLALNPALDPALNPSLTPTIITPAVKPSQKKKKRERESQLS